MTASNFTLPIPPCQRRRRRRKKSLHTTNYLIFLQSFLFLADILLLHSSLWFSACYAFVLPSTITPFSIQSLSTTNIFSGKSGIALFAPFSFVRSSRQYKSKVLLSQATTSSDDSETTTTKTSRDVQYMKMALESARLGYGSTYPNPAVGCVIVQSKDNDEDVIIGRGFHPKSGMPHAEVFALLEAAGHVEDGIQAASSVMPSTEHDEELSKKVYALLQTYIQPDGSKQLFSNIFQTKDDTTTTAYVTLEPCCHTNKQTPPCASTLLLSKINRVVVGYRDPNPSVDGGGVFYLRSNDVNVNILNPNMSIAKDCANIVRYFGKRITSPVALENNDDDDDTANRINGKKKRFLRSLAGRMKREGSLVEVEWPSNNNDQTFYDDGEGEIDWDKTISNILDYTSPPSPQWLTHVDANLWDHEIILLRLGNVVAKKKGVKLLGEELVKKYFKGCSVVQVVGHTVLLYRPSFPTPIIDLDG